ncbi:MAG: hypothetical protein SVO26_01830 [Chloroflexota bacterium]|nr:hypothetical protein [Chloroflexota bacterium]
MNRILTLTVVLAIVIAFSATATPAVAQQPALPDLVIENVSTEWNEVEECWIIHYTILNQGTASAEAGHCTGLCLLGELLNALEPLDYEEVTEELEPGETYSGVFCLPSPWELIWGLIGAEGAGDDERIEGLLQNKLLESSGDGRENLVAQPEDFSLVVELMVVCTDCFGDVEELNEENNCRGVDLPAGIAVIKDVWDPDTGQWVDTIQAVVGQVVEFRCSIRNEEEGPFYGVIALDLLPDTMELVDADPAPLLVLSLPDGTTAVVWYLNLMEDPLEPGETINIGLAAEVVKPGMGTNLQIAIAEWVFMGWDTAIVFGTTGVQPPIVMSGTVLPTAGDTTPESIGEPPPWFMPQDEFLPGEELWIYGEGYNQNESYDVWVVPYTECTHVREGDVLSNLGEWGYITTVTTAEDGSIPPLHILQIPGDSSLICTHWEIVVDNGDGIYQEVDDGLDAMACDEWGFHIYPEAMTIVLFSLGLASLGGYYTLHRRKDTSSDV